MPQAKTFNLRESDVHVAVFVDFNSPLCAHKNRTEQLCKGVAMLNDVSPLKTITCLTTPDVPKASSAHGLADEESSIQPVLWGLRQYCDARWIITFDPAPNSAPFTGMRRWSQGRFVVNFDAKEENVWLNNSEFSIVGRPLRAAPVLPAQRNLLIPESPESVRVADRLRPSARQVCAQKGVELQGTMLDSRRGYPSRGLMWCSSST